ncbi:MAG: response regulator transcription factor [Pirellulales bacterium]|nr:response regulator transcription factor [Pirellulales bacterium]
MRIPSVNPGHIRLMIADHHALCCAGMATMFRTVPEVGEVAVATSAGQALRLARLFQPAVVLMDATLPNFGGFDAARQLQVIRPECGTIFIDHAVCPVHIRAALRAGARGYWTKHASFDQIVHAVRRVVRGERSFCPEVQAHLVQTRAGMHFQADLVGTPLSRLTPRELEVLVYLADGMSVKCCAQRMSLSASTVDNHKARLMRKLDVHNVVQLVKLAAREGLIDP